MREGGRGRFKPVTRPRVVIRSGGVAQGLAFSCFRGPDGGFQKLKNPYGRGLHLLHRRMGPVDVAGIVTLGGLEPPAVNIRMRRFQLAEGRKVPIGRGCIAVVELAEAAGMMIGQLVRAQRLTAGEHVRKALLPDHVVRHGDAQNLMRHVEFDELRKLAAGGLFHPVHALGDGAQGLHIAGRVRRDLGDAGGDLIGGSRLLAQDGGDLIHAAGHIRHRVAQGLHRLRDLGHRVLAGFNGVVGAGHGGFDLGHLGKQGFKSGHGSLRLLLRSALTATEPRWRPRQSPCPPRPRARPRWWR